MVDPCVVKRAHPAAGLVLVKMLNFLDDDRDALFEGIEDVLVGIRFAMKGRIRKFITRNY